MIDKIKITTALKKVDGEWKKFSRDQIEREEDIDGMVFKTTSGNMFRISMKKDAKDS
jgi:hypothetical protein